MRGSITLNAPCYLPALVGSAVHGNSLLASLAGNAGAAVDPASDAERAKAHGSRKVAPGVGEPQVQRDIAQFRQALATARTPAQLLANATALKVLLTVNGLTDQGGNGALAVRVLLSNPARANSLLNQLKDARWNSVNAAYAFATRGLAALREPATIAAIASSYAEALRPTGPDEAPAAAPNTHAFEQHTEATETN
jgi:hypothetical protein